MDLELEKEEWVREFYSRLRQPHISSEKLKEGVSILNKLLKDGFTEEQICFAIQWIPDHIPDAYSIGILPKVIGQTLQDDAKLKKQQEKTRLRQEINDRLLEEEITRLDEEAARKMGRREADTATKEVA